MKQNYTSFSKYFPRVSLEQYEKLIAVVSRRHSLMNDESLNTSQTRSLYTFLFLNTSKDPKISLEATKLLKFLYGELHLNEFPKDMRDKDTILMTEILFMKNFPEIEIKEFISQSIESSELNAFVEAYTELYSFLPQFEKKQIYAPIGLERVTLDKLFSLPVKEVKEQSSLVEGIFSPYSENILYLRKWALSDPQFGTSAQTFFSAWDAELLPAIFASKFREENVLECMRKYLKMKHLLKFEKYNFGNYSSEDAHVFFAFVENLEEIDESFSFSFLDKYFHEFDCASKIIQGEQFKTSMKQLDNMMLTYKKKKGIDNTRSVITQREEFPIESQKLLHKKIKAFYEILDAIEEERFLPSSYTGTSGREVMRNDLLSIQEFLVIVDHLLTEEEEVVRDHLKSSVIVELLTSFQRSHGILLKEVKNIPEAQITIDLFNAVCRQIGPI